MKQTDLNRAVARATGESVATIKRLGFLIAAPEELLDPDSEEHGPFVIDWDELAGERYARTTGRPDYESAIA
ncbi:MAG: hypothetical protein DWQ35_13760 [Planctomycetota bacterium]|nr:MAG: hypothetical protein DWQ35_13760 [Planctomycetota bacterium]REK25991.1 MAG: hypothetical protein DWQ42_10200 [Planctomycetota bacterium]REK46894.1 MAG: hypothetical protein DWQ46_05205 [Planctomycetota bacterium]